MAISERASMGIATLHPHAQPDESIEDTRSRLFALCHAFLPELWNSKAVSQLLLAGCYRPGNVATLYRGTVDLFSGLSEVELPVPGFTVEENFAWLLRDVADLDYTEIANVLEVSRAKVRHMITAVRTAVLAEVLAPKRTSRPRRPAPTRLHARPA